MNKAYFLVLGTVMALGSSLFAGAGCSSNSSGSGGSGSGGGAASSSASTTGSTSSASTTSSSTGGAMATCAGYCTAIMANCKDPLATQQYKDMTSCMNVCGTFPQGAIGAMDDSLECRNYHAGAAMATPMLHCEHAGPTGGAKSGAAADDGPCGNGCEAFCALAVKTCPTQAVDKATCTTMCNGFTKDAAAYSVADVDKNDFGCRMYHLSVAATDAAAATLHCPHIVTVSATCNK
jgi:hypothetical protein